MNNIQKPDLDIPLGNEKLELKEFTKYIGIYIDSKLSWEKQIQITNSKQQKGIGIIRTMRHFSQKKKFKLLFLAFLSPYLEYGTPAWVGAVKTQVNKLDRNLRKAIRLIMFKDKIVSISKYFPLELNVKLLQDKFMKRLILEEQQKIICGKYPTITHP